MAHLVQRARFHNLFLSPKTIHSKLIRMEESLVVLGASKQRLSLLYFVLQFVEQLASIFMVNFNEVVFMVKNRVSKD